MTADERDDLRPDETELVGQWLDTGSRIEGDAVGARIAWLTARRLVRLGAVGRDALFRDPRDGRLWELTHPHGAWPTGGPPRLTAIPAGAAARRYGTTGG